jgi:hypothetical protein
MRERFGRPRENDWGSGAAALQRNIGVTPMARRY